MFHYNACSIPFLHNFLTLLCLSIGCMSRLEYFIAAFLFEFPSPKKEAPFFFFLFLISLSYIHTLLGRDDNL